MKIILASRSPARRKLMEELGIKFECHTGDYEENMELFDEPATLAKHLAVGKATSIAHKFPNAVIIGADTFITIEKEKVGKPSNLAAAKQIIKKMSGKTIKVHSGIALIQTDEESKISQQLAEHVLTSLKIKKMTTHEINTLAGQEEALQISGAFSIEGEGGKMVERIDGDYNNVIGLPLFKLRIMLKKMGINLA